MNSQKRITVHLIPYYIQNSKCFVFLQKRSLNIERNPGAISIFGGGVEKNETNEEALVREIGEELHYVPIYPILLGTYEDEHSISTYYKEAVSADFVSQVKIGEGEYGVFYSKEKTANEPLLSNSSKKVLDDFFNTFK